MKKVTGWNWLLLALLAFAGLGLEAVLAFVVEPLVYGVQMGQWNTAQNIAHWVMTCILWGVIFVILVRWARKRFDFDLMAPGTKVRLWQWILIAGLVVFSLIVSCIDWNGIKVLKELAYNGWLKFIFQYIYYVFETALVMLIIIFGQLAFEEWLVKKNIPYGGFILALTWGAAHFFTKDYVTGIICIISGLAFGSVYLLAGRDVKKSFPIMFAMFVL